MPIRTTIRRLLAAASLTCSGAYLLSGCGGSAVDSGRPSSDAGAAGAACPLPATALLPPVCVACIHDSCPAVYADLCSANCGADELGAACLSAQREVGDCIGASCQVACARTHGSAVGGAGNGSPVGPATTAGSGGSSALSGSGGSAESAGAAGGGLAEGGAAGADPIAGDAGSGGVADPCSAALPLKCGDRLNHSTLTQGRPNEWSLYSSTQRAESGRETLYAISTATECSVVARLKNLHTDLDLLLVPACNSLSSEKASSTPLDLQTVETFSWTNQADQVSYVVVDGYAGVEGSYTLEIDCECGP